jgi:hypothetical protein
MNPTRRSESRLPMGVAHTFRVDSDMRQGTPETEKQDDPAGTIGHVAVLA